MSFAFTTITIQSYAEVSSVLAPLFNLNVRTISDGVCVLYTKNNAYGLYIGNNGYVTVYANNDYKATYSASHPFPWTVRYWKKGSKFVFYIDNGNPTYFASSGFTIKNIETSEVLQTRDILIYLCQTPYGGSSYCQFVTIANANGAWTWGGSGLTNSEGGFFKYNKDSYPGETTPTIILPFKVCWNNKQLGEADDLYVPLVWQTNNNNAQEIMTLNGKEYYKFPFFMNRWLLDVS